jgi:hypothetical protein
LPDLENIQETDQLLGHALQEIHVSHRILSGILFMVSNHGLIIHKDTKP